MRVTCPDCGAEVPRETDRCPSCATSFLDPGRWQSVMLAVFLALFFFALAAFGTPLVFADAALVVLGVVLLGIAYVLTKARKPGYPGSRAGRFARWLLEE